MGFWSALARFILRNRTFLLILIAAITFALSTQWDNMRFSTTEANLLPDDHYINVEYNKFLEKHISKKLVCTNPDLIVHQIIQCIK